MITQADIQKMVDIIADQFHPEKIILLGSRARGSARPGSDVDLLVIAASAAPRWERAAPLYGYLRHFLFPIDIVVYTPEEIREWSGVPEAFVPRALAEGKVLYERSA